MKRAIALVFSIFVTVTTSVLPDYWHRRAQILAQEQFSSLGGNLHFRSDERTVSDILMAAKREELDLGFKNPNKFFPAKNFMTVIDDIKESKVFQMIEKLPKGAILHTHDTSIVSADFVYNNITFRDNLYICDDSGDLQLHFFLIPENNCKWELLSEVRRNESRAVDVNRRIRRALTMVVDDPKTMYPDINAAWMSFMKIFTILTPLLTYRPVFEDYFYQGLQEIHDDNVIYLELRTTLPTLYELNGTEYSALDVVRIYKEVNHRFVTNHPNFIGSKIIYAPLRSATQEQFQKNLDILHTIKQAYPEFVAGFDLVGQEDKGEPLSSFVNQLRDLPDDIKLFFHAGETDWYGFSTDENLLDAVLLNATRIGHGYALLKHPKIMELARSLDIALEVNPISNQVLALVDDLRNHPANALFAEGYPIVISNDDPGLWGARALSYDFYEAFLGLMSREADLRALKQLALNSLKYSVMSDSDRRRAAEIWKNKWDEFITNLIQESTFHSSTQPSLTQSDVNDIDNSILRVSRSTESGFSGIRVESI